MRTANLVSYDHLGGPINKDKVKRGTVNYKKKGLKSKARRYAAPSFIVDQAIGSGTEFTTCPAEPKPRSAS